MILIVLLMILFGQGAWFFAHPLLTFLLVLFLA